MDKEEARKRVKEFLTDGDPEEAPLRTGGGPNWHDAMEKALQLPEEKLAATLYEVLSEMDEHNIKEIKNMQSMMLTIVDDVLAAADETEQALMDKLMKESSEIQTCTPLESTIEVVVCEENGAWGASTCAYFCHATGTSKEEALGRVRNSLGWVYGEWGWTVGFNITNEEK